MWPDIQIRLSALQSAQLTIQSLSLLEAPFTDKLRQVMLTLKELVPADTVNVGTIDFETRQGSYYALEGFLMPPARRALLPAFVDEHPMLRAAQEGRACGPHRFTDFYSRRMFEETALYRECYKGYTHSMMTLSVPSPGGLNVSFALSRADKEFSDTDRDLLAMLQPVISLFMENALLHAAIEIGGVTESAGVLLGSGPHAYYMNERAEKILRRRYPGSPPHRLPDELKRAICSAGGKDFILEPNSAARLRVRVRGGFAAWTMMLSEESIANQRNRMIRHGLTSREAEVLEWVSKGKSNADIGIIFGISPRTVEKHLERIYAKLGVDSRQAAACVFRSEA